MINEDETPKENRSRFSALVSDAKRRRIFQVAGYYAAGAFTVLQIADIVMPALGFSDESISYILLFIAWGFPVAMILTWIFDITREGIQLTPGLTSLEKSKLAPGRAIDLVILLVALAVAFLYAVELISTIEDDSEKRLLKKAYEPSIAVIPFSNHSEAVDTTFLATGIQDDIRSYLTQNSKFKVSSKTSSGLYGSSDMSVPEIAHQLDVNFILEGNIRSTESRVRISIQLVHAKTDKLIWSNMYDSRLGDTISIQDEVARDVSNSLIQLFDILESIPVDASDEAEASGF